MTAADNGDHADVVAEIVATLDLPDGADSWADVDLTDALAGNGPAPPTVGTVTGATGLFYPGRVHWLYGEPEVGKGWAVLGVTAQLLTGGAHVVYLDFEDTAEGVTARLLDLAVPADTILTRFHYVRPEVPSVVGIAALCERIALAGSPLVIIDGVTEAMALLGLDHERNTDIARFLLGLSRPLAATGAAVACLDHVTKNTEGRGRWAIGGQHKLAGLDGIAWTVDAVEAFARGRDGRLKLTVAKDRSGHYRRGDRVDVTVTAYPDGGVHLDYARFEPDLEWEPTALMAKVAAHVALYPGVGKNDLVKLGKKTYAQQAVALLVERGHLRVETVGQQHRHYPTDTPYQQNDEP